jgi:hypothetical protein
MSILSPQELERHEQRQRQQRPTAPAQPRRTALHVSPQRRVTAAQGQGQRPHHALHINKVCSALNPDNEKTAAAGLQAQACPSPQEPTSNKPRSKSDKRIFRSSKSRTNGACLIKSSGLPSERGAEEVLNEQKRRVLSISACCPCEEISARRRVREPLVLTISPL